MGLDRGRRIRDMALRQEYATPDQPELNIPLAIDGSYCFLGLHSLTGF